MTTETTEVPIMNTTETALQNSFADLSVEFDSQPDVTIVTEDSPTLEIMPPAPPSVDEETFFVPGEFKYIKCKSSREMLQNAYQAVNQTETWSFVKRDIESFSFSNAPEIWRITDKMVELGYDGHSGSTFGWTMRQMQTIAREGEQAYKKMAEKWKK
jgi:hypothetical protein